jgi:aldose 1-epimerase
MPHTPMARHHIGEARISHQNLRASILTIGASLCDLTVAMPAGPRRVILRHASPETYLDNPHYLGAIAGRCANRIRDGQCRIGDREYQLDRNENHTTHLHGGGNGFSRKSWSIESHTDRAVVLSLQSEDGDQGYPGNASVSCTYEILPGARLRLTLRAMSDADTLMNLAGHGYFNLQPGTAILDHSLRINADYYTPVDPALIPDGRILAVEGTCFDFRVPGRIGERRGQSPLGFDHNFVLAAAPRRKPRLAATLVSPSQDLSMHVLTTEPGLQFYDGQKLSPDPGEPAGDLRPFAACCLEPQRHPDAVHHPHFAQALLQANREYLQVTEYHFEY